MDLFFHDGQRGNNDECLDNVMEQIRVSGWSANPANLAFYSVGDDLETFTHIPQGEFVNWVFDGAENKKLYVGTLNAQIIRNPADWGHESVFDFGP